MQSFELSLQGSSRSPWDSSYYKKVPKSSSIKVIDFGSTTYERADQNYIVSTRHYRAPEVILGKVFETLLVHAPPSSGLVLYVLFCFPEISCYM